MDVRVPGATIGRFRPDQDCRGMLPACGTYRPEQLSSSTLPLMIGWPLNQGSREEKYSDRSTAGRMLSVVEFQDFAAEALVSLQDKHLNSGPWAHQLVVWAS